MKRLLLLLVMLPVILALTIPSQNSHHKLVTRGREGVSIKDYTKKLLSNLPGNKGYTPRPAKNTATGKKKSSWRNNRESWRRTRAGFKGFVASVRELFRTSRKNQAVEEHPPVNKPMKETHEKSAKSPEPATHEPNPHEDEPIAKPVISKEEATNKMLTPGVGNEEGNGDDPNEVYEDALTGYEKYSLDTIEGIEKAARTLKLLSFSKEMKDELKTYKEQKSLQNDHPRVIEMVMQRGPIEKKMEDMYKAEDSFLDAKKDMQGEIDKKDRLLRKMEVFYIEYVEAVGKPAGLPLPRDERLKKWWISGAISGKMKKDSKRKELRAGRKNLNQIPEEVED